MELGGTEKRIQALFSDQSLEDRRHVPRFEQLWRRAETTRPVRAVSRSLAMAAAVLIMAAIMFAFWSRQSQIALNIAPLDLPAPALRQPDKLASLELPRSRPERQKRTVRPRPTERFVTTEAAQLSRWQSPTQSFMQSPTSTRFDSLPQLNQSAKDLESFLPKMNEMKKESNR
jgi:hypothetical protein